ncbi:MAG: DsbA family protein [Alphaproteobacteria bacterium]|nr:DsbA family protein [Alphaproteobacteria bacterium]
MRIRALVLSTVLVVAIGAGIGLALLSLPSREDVAKQVSFGEKVRTYLITNPEVFTEAARILQQRSDAQRVAARKRTLGAFRRLIRSPRGLPVLGNAEADVTVVEFFDYRCPFCKRSLEVLHRLVTDDPKLRIVFKEFPILGPESVFASRVAIAAHAQGKYLEVHDALMSHRGQFDEQTVLGIARGLGIDIERLRADMQKPRVARIIREARLLADRLAITGTPALVIGDEVVNGYADLVTLKSLVMQARKTCDTC